MLAVPLGGRDVPDEADECERRVVVRDDEDGGVRFRLALERVVAEISSRLIDTRASAVGPVVGRSLAELGDLFDVDHCFLMALDDASGIVAVEEWSDEHVTVRLGRLEWLSPDALRWFTDRLAKETVVLRVDDPEDVTPPGIHDRLADEGVHTMVLVGIPVDDRIRGVVGFTTVDRPFSLSEESIDLVRLVGASFVFGYGRAQAEAELEQVTRDLQERNAELVRVNRDLQEFAMVAAHDLKSPLYAAQGFLELLDGKRPMLDDEGCTFLDAAMRGTTRMRQLVEDLLTYSQVGWSPIERHDVDLGQLARAVIADVAFGPSGADVVANVKDLPVVFGDETMLRQLLQNLVTNAAKYARPHVRPRIEIGGRRDGRGWTIWVADNGVGIEKNERTRVFEMFTRLETSPGSGAGIGLAICERVVAAHGGAIWVEDGIDGGTKVCFNLPDP